MDGRLPPPDHLPSPFCLNCRKNPRPCPADSVVDRQGVGPRRKPTSPRSVQIPDFTRLFAPISSPETVQTTRTHENFVSRNRQRRVATRGRGSPLPPATRPRPRPRQGRQTRAAASPTGWNVGQLPLSRSPDSTNPRHVDCPPRAARVRDANKQLARHAAAVCPPQARPINAAQTYAVP